MTVPPAKPARRSPTPEGLARKELGRRGEEAALRFLVETQGAELVARNWRCPLGELDLVVRIGRCVVFVEVKANARPGPIGAELRVGHAKQAKLSRLADAFLCGRGWFRVPARFDIVAVTFRGEGVPPDIRHFADAFPSSV